jgi:SMC interacting uncharacterized protein involved in chromosome segregation
MIKDIKLQKIIIILLFIIGFTNNTFAQVPLKPTPTVINQTATSTIGLIEKQNEQLKKTVWELKIQNKSLTEFQSSLLSTVYWSLGFLASITTLLVGLGWWSNFKVHEKDKESLKNEVLSLISKFESNWRSVVSEFRREDNLLLEKRIQEVKALIDKNADEAKSQIKDISEVAKELEASLDSLKSKFEVHKDEVDKSNYEIDLELRVVEVEVWDLKGVYSNVLLTQAQGIRSAQFIGNSPVHNLLEDMKESLNKIINDNYVCKEYSFNRVKEIISTVEKHDVLVGEILSLLSKVKTQP